MSKNAFLVFILSQFFFISNLHSQSVNNDFHSKTNSDSLVSVVLQSVNPDSVRFVIQSLQDFETRYAFADNRRDVADWIVQRFYDMGYANVFLDSFLLIINVEYNACIFAGWQYNVIASLPGHVDSSKYYILGAHYDSYTDSIHYANISCPPNRNISEIPAPGADDNASGVAAILETARVFKEHNINPQNTILFVAFAAEEVGLHGSFHLAKKLKRKNGDIVLMINNDLISYSPDNQQPWKYRMWKNNDWIEPVVQDIVNNYTCLEFDSYATGMTDHLSFNLFGFDAVWFRHNFGTNHIHKTTDVIDSINIDYCAEMIKISCGILLKEILSDNSFKKDISFEHISNDNQQNKPLSLHDLLFTDEPYPVYYGTLNDDGEIFYKEQIQSQIQQFNSISPYEYDFETPNGHNIILKNKYLFE